MLRTLVIDGGPGPLVQLPILREVERYSLKQWGTSFIESVEFISGTSNGGLCGMFIAHALSKGKTGLEAIEGCIDFQWRFLRAGMRPSFFGLVRGLSGWGSLVHRQFRDVMKDTFGDDTFDSLGEHKLAILAFNVDDWIRFTFRNYEPWPSSRVKIADVATATGAFPVMAPAIRVREAQALGATLIDGGLVANNPCMVALSDAALHLGKERIDEGTFFRDGAADLLGSVRMVSIGATPSKSLRDAGPIPEFILAPLRRLLPSFAGAPDREGLQDWGWIHWTLFAPTYAPLMLLTGASNNDAYHARVLLGDRRFSRCEVDFNLLRPLLFLNLNAARRWCEATAATMWREAMGEVPANETGPIKRSDGRCDVDHASATDNPIRRLLQFLGTSWFDRPSSAVTAAQESRSQSLIG